MHSYVTLPADDRPTLVAADCHEAVRLMTEAGIRFDSIVTAPPYGVGEWDLGIPPVAVWRTLLESLKPGSFIAATGNPKTYHRQVTRMEDAGFVIQDTLMWVFGDGYSVKVGEAAWAVHQEQMGSRAKIQRGILTADSTQWRGWGSRLRPNYEPITLAQRPGERMSLNLLRHGVGALNYQVTPPGQMKLFGGAGEQKRPPGNLMMDDESRDELAAMFGPQRWRMFYARHVSGTERHAGVTGKNEHPTVHPIRLMRWLISLVTPPGGLVLDPFVGSGTTGCAAALEDCRFVGVDLDPAFLRVAQQRIDHWRAEHQKSKRQELTKKDRPSVMPRVRILGREDKLQSRAPVDGVRRCRNNHPLTAETIYHRPDGREECMICKRANRHK